MDNNMSIHHILTWNKYIFSLHLPVAWWPDGSGCLVCRTGHVITSLQVHDWPLRIDSFTKRHKLVHNGGSSKFEALYGSLNIVNSTKISYNLSYKAQLSKSQSFKPIQKLQRFFNISAIMDQLSCCYAWRHRKQVYISLSDWGSPQFVFMLL